MNLLRNFKIWIYIEDLNWEKLFSFFVSDKNDKDFFYSEIWNNLQKIFEIFFEKNIFFNEFQKIDWVFCDLENFENFFWKNKINIFEKINLSKKPIFIPNWEENIFEIKAAKNFLEKINCRISESENISKKIEKKKILLHVCCWVDVVYPILILKDRFELIAYWYDPNIHPEQEYDKRFETFKEICEKYWVKIIKWKYDAKSFLQKIEHLKNTPEMWEKCTVCYDYRLWSSAELAKEIWADAWTTTLNSSPLKSFEKLTIIWKRYEKKFWVSYLNLNFRRWQVEVSKYCKENNVYRQNYCWCVYSDTFLEWFSAEEVERDILNKK